AGMKAIGAAIRSSFGRARRPRSRGANPGGSRRGRANPSGARTEKKGDRLAPLREPAVSRWALKERWQNIVMAFGRSPSLRTTTLNAPDTLSEYYCSGRARSAELG